MKIQKNQKGKYPQLASPHCLTTSPSFRNYKIKALLLSRRYLLLTVTLPEGKRAVRKYVRNPTTKGNLDISCALFLSPSGYFLVLPKYFPALYLLISSFTSVTLLIPLFASICLMFSVNRHLC